MDDVILVQVLDSLQNLVEKLLEFVFFEQGIDFEVLHQISLAHELKHHVDVLVVFEHLEKLDDCLIVVDVLQNLDFFLYLLEGVFVLDVDQGNDLQRHVDSSQELGGEVDLPETALPNLLDDFVEGNVGLELGEELRVFLVVPLLERGFDFLDEVLSQLVFLEDLF